MVLSLNSHDARRLVVLFFSLLFPFVSLVHLLELMIVAGQDSVVLERLHRGRAGVGCVLGCDVFDLVEPVQGELPRRTEPSLCWCSLGSLSLFLSLCSSPHSLSLRHGQGLGSGYEDALEDARQVSQGQFNKHVLQVG